MLKGKICVRRETEQLAEQLLKELLALARLAPDVVIGEADHNPAVQDEMVLTHEVVRELSTVSIPKVGAVAVNLDANFVGLAQIRIV